MLLVVVILIHTKRRLAKTPVKFCARDCFLRIHETYMSCPLSSRQPHSDSRNKILSSHTACHGWRYSNSVLDLENGSLQVTVGNRIEGKVEVSKRGWRMWRFCPLRPSHRSASFWWKWWQSLILWERASGPGWGWSMYLWVCVCLVGLFNLRGLMFWSVSYNIISGQFGFACQALVFDKYFNVCRLRDRVGRWEDVRVCVSRARVCASWLCTILFLVVLWMYEIKWHH